MKYFLLLAIFLVGCEEKNADILNIKPKHSTVQCVALSTDQKACRLSILIDEDNKDPAEEMDICYIEWSVGLGKSSTGRTVTISCENYEKIKAKGISF